MTLWASEVHENNPRLRIHSNHGNTVTITAPEFGKATRVVIEDDLASMKSLWNSLGTLIAKKEHTE